VIEYSNRVFYVKFTPLVTPLSLRPARLFPGLLGEAAIFVRNVPPSLEIIP
jgi:hypothetical protein